MITTAVWIWEPRAWTEPQSAISRAWLEVQGGLVVVIIALAGLGLLYLLNHAKRERPPRPPSTPWFYPAAAKPDLSKQPSAPPAPPPKR
jgi:hypothetical protein